jgi:hypothetical protein
VRGGVDTATYVTPCFSYTITLKCLEEEGDSVGMPKAQTHCPRNGVPGPLRAVVRARNNCSMKFRSRSGPTFTELVDRQLTIQSGSCR